MTLGIPGRIAVDRPQEREVVRGIRWKTIGSDGRIRGRDRGRDQGPSRIRATIPVIIALVLLRLDHAVVQRRIAEDPEVALAVSDAIRDPTPTRDVETHSESAT